MEDDIRLVSMMELSQKTASSKPIVEGLIVGPNVSVISGTTKSGKTTLALQMAYSIASATSFLGKKVTQGKVLYISLDNEEELVAERIRKMKLELSDMLYFYFEAPLVLKKSEAGQKSLEEVTAAFIKEKGALDVVFIDLFDNIRNLTEKNEYSNAKVAEDISVLKALAKKYQVAIVLLNQDIKSEHSNGYKSTRGGMNLIGSINGGYIHLIRNGIGKADAVLEIGGRNIPEQRYKIELDFKKMEYSRVYEPEDEIDYNLAVVRNFISRKGDFTGTITELLSQTNLAISTTALGRLLSKNTDLLKREGIEMSKDSSRTKGRIIHLSKISDDE